jgi:hypothetical protein
VGSFLTSILQNAGRAGSDINEAKNANLQQKQQIQNYQLQMKELQQRLGQQAAPQVVHTYRGSDSKLHNLVRDPMSGKITDQVAEGGTTELSPMQQKKTDAERLLGRPLTDKETQILVGTAPKPSASQDLQDKWAEATKIGAQQFPNDPQKAMEFARSLMPGGAAVNQVVFPQLKKTAGLDPIITSQIGKPPDASAYPNGEQDPIYKAKAKQWGIEAETIKNRMAEARGMGYNMSRVGPYVNNDGELVTATAGQALANGFTPAAPTFQLMSKQAQFQEMENASGKLRGAIEALQPGDAFTPDQVAKLSLAARAPDEGTFHSIVSNLASSTTNERQQDYLIWLQQMGERILSLRNVAGMGQGAQDLRAAIQATLPNLSSGSKEFALKRLDAVDNQIKLLHQGIGKLKNTPQTGNNTPPPGATIIKWEDVK